MAGHPANPLHPRVFRINNTTGAIDDITSLCEFNPLAEQGRIVYRDPDIAGYTFIVDYYIDWAYATNFNLMFRTFASLPPFSDSSTVPPQRLRGFTLAPNGVLYITTGTDGTDPNIASGSVIALQEQSPPTQQQTRGGSKVLWRWQSHGGYSQIVPGPERTDPVIVPPSTIYREPNEYFMRFVGQFLRFSHDYRAERERRTATPVDELHLQRRAHLLRRRGICLRGRAIRAFGLPFHIPLHHRDYRFGCRARTVRD
jgi:hypothetical protein